MCRPKVLGLEDVTPEALGVLYDLGVDYAEELGITKWVPEIPTAMSGKVIPAPELIRWPDIENLKRYPGIFTDGEPVVATEKIHGTCCLVTLDRKAGKLFVSSKGFGERSLALESNPSNLYWRAVMAFELDIKLGEVLKSLPRASSIALFGEVYGQGVQDLGYGKAASRNETLGFVAFDMVVVMPNAGKLWLNPDEFAEMAQEYAIPTAPVLYTGPFDVDVLTLIASGKTVLGEGAHIREGIVIRPEVETTSDVLGGRKIAKLVSDDYLMRKNATEFE